MSDDEAIALARARTPAMTLSMAHAHGARISQHGLAGAIYASSGLQLCYPSLLVPI